jgi:hypothetical protein
MKIEIATCVIELIFSKFASLNNIKEIKNYFSGFTTKKRQVYFKIIFLHKKTKKITNNSVYVNPDINLDQFILLIISILRKFLTNKGFFLHCAANIINNKEAVIFLGPSSAGKSTISKILDSRFKKIVDDVAIVVQRNNNFYIYQAPLKEKNILPKTKKGYKIKAAFFLKKSPRIKLIKQSDQIKNMSLIYKEIWIDKTQLKQQLILMGNFVQKIPIFKFFVNKNESEIINFFQNITLRTNTPSAKKIL